MSDHQNQYHHQPHRHQQHPYPVEMQHHPQHYHMGQVPHGSSHSSHHPIPSSSSSSGASAAGESRSSSGNKRSAASISSSSTTPALSSPTSSSIDAAVVAQTPSTTSTSSPMATPASTARGAKKAKKSSPRSSPNGDGGSVKSTGTTGAARGLRHFSMMVCQKVEEKGTTTYNEVADELVKKVIAERRQEDPNGSFDQKNIRRRVYDALNVLMAMDIISKHKKEITWKGLPTAAKQDMDSMSKDIEYYQNQIAHKKEALKDLLTQQVCFRNLVHRNQQREKSTPPPPRSKMGMPDEKIPLPFIVVNTNQSAVIQCDMSRDRTNVMFDFSLPFEINDDNTILKKMQMDRTSMSTLRQMLPEDLLHYCETNRLIDGVLGREGPHDEHGQSQQRMEPPQELLHEVKPPSHHHQQSHPSDRRGNISISSSGRLGRTGLHDHHQQLLHPHHVGHYPYDHHPVRESSGRGGHLHRLPPSGPAVVPSSVSSSRRGVRDPYSY